MIFQDPMTTLNPAYTIGNQLVEGYMQHRRASRREAVDRAVFLLNRTGITAARSRLSQYPHQLSGGLRQRIVIAMALMCEPDLIIADEPTTALDVTVQAQILLLIKDIQAEMHAGVIIITHDLGVVAQMADRVAVMYAGDVVETGPTAAIFAQPKHPYTIGLLSCMPDVGRGARLGQIPGVVPSLVGDVQGCAFRTRCSAATGACRGDIPVRRHDDGHRWNCTRPVEGAWVVEEAGTDTLFDGAWHPYTQALLEAALPTVPGRGLPALDVGWEFPNPIDPPSGCAFHPRCTRAIERCAVENPDLAPNGARHCACHLAGP